MKDDLWKRAQEFAVKDPLPQDILLYSAFDVDPLLELYRITNERLQPEFRTICDDLCELELFR